MPFTPKFNSATSEFASQKCPHPYTIKTCPQCTRKFCYNCCIGTNVDQGGKYDSDYMFCPHCGWDYYQAA